MAWTVEDFRHHKKPILAGHRGFSACYPENTLIAFEKAAELGVDMVELDISMTKDGVAALFHDHVLDYKTPLKGHVRDHTLAQLQAIPFGPMLNPPMPATQIPTLEALLELYQKHPDILLNVDLKPGCGVARTVKPVLEVLERYGYLDRCIFNSIDGEITRHLHEHTDFLVVGPPIDYPGSVNHISGEGGTITTLDAVCIPTETLTPEIVDYYRSLNKIIVSAPVADEAGTRRAIDCGVEIIMSDDPRHYLRLTAQP